MTMHSTLTVALFGAIALTAALPAVAADRPVCFQTNLIDHTSIPDDNTILFHMRGHKIFKAALVNRFVGLKENSRGFTYSPTIPGSNQICANLLTIRLNDTGQVCLIGDITPVEPPAPVTQ